VHHFTPAWAIESNYSANQRKYILYKKDGVIARIRRGLLIVSKPQKERGWPVAGPGLSRIIFAFEDIFLEGKC
jgi:hypothetical protein